MQPFRPRWTDRSGAIIAIVGLGLGMTLIQQQWPVGVQLITWLILLCVFCIPFVVLELGTGSIFQDSLSESCRKSAKHSEIVGWIAVAVALVAMILVTNQASVFLGFAYDSVLAAIANQPNQLTVHADAMLAPESKGGLLVVAILLALVQVRLWRGAPVIARTSTLLVIMGTTGVLLITALLMLRPGAINGLSYLLAPENNKLDALWTPGPWVFSAGVIIVSWAMGSGALTAYGSYFNRSSDTTGIGVLSVLICSLGQFILFLSFALGQQVIHPGQVAFDQEVLWGPMAVGAVLANVGWPSWWSALMIAIWFLSLGSFLMVALLALIEAVTSPLVDKFRIGRERVVPGLCLTVFFVCAIIGQEEATPSWAIDGLFGAMVFTTLCQAIVAWRAMKLDAITRHLNAYSAFRLHYTYRFIIALAIPLLSCVLLVFWSMGKMEWPMIATMLVCMCVAAIITTRLQGRNG